MFRIKKYSLILLALSFGVSCQSDEKPRDTTTRGEVKIQIDESFKPFFENQIYTFESIYPGAKIQAEYINEEKALQSLIADSCKVVVISRDISPDEKKLFESKSIFPITTKIAEDAIAFIVNKQNTILSATKEKITSILLGKDSLWKQLNVDLGDEAITIVFDGRGSANMNYVKDSILQGKSFSNNTFALSSNVEVVDYVSKKRNAIGIIGANMISDKHDAMTKEVLSKVNVLAVSLEDSEKPVKPYQAYIQTKEYPFTRNIYMISRQTRAGLGMGFVSFVAGEKGQLMIQKAGLIPAIAPARFVEVKTN